MDPPGMNMQSEYSTMIASLIIVLVHKNGIIECLIKMQISAENLTSHLQKRELYRAQQLLGKFAAHHKRLWDGLFQNI